MKSLFDKVNELAQRAVQGVLDHPKRAVVIIIVLVIIAVAV